MVEFLVRIKIQNAIQDPVGDPKGRAVSILQKYRLNLTLIRPFAKQLQNPCYRPQL